MTTAENPEGFEALLDVPEDLVPSRTDNPDPTVSLDFDGLLASPLRLKQDLKEGCGGKTWPAGMVLSEYLLRYKLDTLKGKRILDLGSGSGLVGIAIAVGLSSSPPTHHDSRITVTDIPSMVPLLKENVALNPTDTFIQASPLSWGEPLPPDAPFEVPDIILAADCCYFEPAFPLLLDTLEKLLVMTANACCYFCFKKRRNADLGFVKMAKKRFNVKDGGLDDPRRQVWQREGIFL